jgi:hypothetical protein
MSDYKGIKEIVLFFKKNGSSFNLALVGNCPDLNLVHWLALMTHGTNIHVDTVNVDDSSIIDYHVKSRYVLFNYLPNSAIISASVMFSISLGSRVCMRRGLQYENFAKAGFIFLFESLDDFLLFFSNFKWSLENQIDYVVANDWKSYRLIMSKLLL